MNTWKQIIAKKSIRILFYGTGFLLSMLGIFWVYQSNQQEGPVYSANYLVYEPTFNVRTTQATSVWDEGTDLTELNEQQAGYFFASQPIIEYMATLELEDVQSYDLTGEFISQAFLVSFDEAQQEYWRYPLTTEKTEELALVEDNGLIQQTITYDSIDMALIQSVQEEIQEELGFNGGTIEVLYETSLKLEGTVDEKPVEEIFEHSFPFALQSSYFTAPALENYADRIVLGEHSNEPSVESLSFWHIAADYGLLVFVSLTLLTLLLREWFNSTEKQKTLADERRRFEEWITDGHVNLSDKTIIKVSDLKGLVDLAIDLEKRVIYDEEFNNFTVLEDSFVYIYDPEKEEKVKKWNTPQFGDLLLQMDLITPRQLETGLNYQETFGGRIGESLLSLGFLDETSLYSTLARQSNLSFYSFDPQKVGINKEWLGDMEIKDYIQYEIVPIGERDDRSLILSTANPLEEDLKKKIRTTLNRSIVFVMSPPTAIRQLLDRYDTLINHENTNEQNQKEVINYVSEKLTLLNKYQKGKLDLFAFVYLARLANREQLLAIPDYRSIATWLVRKNILSEELGHLLHAFQCAVTSLSVEQTKAFELPSILRVLEAGSYLTESERNHLEEEYSENQEELLEHLVNNYYLSPATKKEVVMLYSKLAEILTP